MGPFAGEAHLQTVEERDGWSTTGPHAGAELRTDGLEPASQTVRCSDGTRDWVVSFDGTPNSIAGALRYCVVALSVAVLERTIVAWCSVHCVVSWC